MKILLVNTFDRGGAANSCLRLHAGLLKKGIKSKLLIRINSRNLPFVEVAKPLQPKKTKYQNVKKAFRSILRRISLYRNTPIEEVSFYQRRDPDLEMFSYPSSNIDVTENLTYKNAEIINLHWVTNLLDYNSFFRKNKKPVVWTLHDMNPFSGGEHYKELYSGIDENGYPIKRIIAEWENEEFQNIIQIKKEALKQIKNLTIVAPSKWLAVEARNSEVFKGNPVHCIPYGVDSNVFSPRNKSFSRNLLNLPEEKLVILFVADSIAKFRKGFDFLKRAIQHLEMDNIMLCTVGSKNQEMLPDMEILELGIIHDERLMSAIYSAADVFVIPSVMDNLPNTVLESLMCGTPVIGFPTGGIPDMIENGKNGLLTEEISVNSLVKALKEFLADPNRFDRKKIRLEALNKYDDKIQAENYIKLFKEILKA